MNKRYSLHKIYKEENIPFNILEYSSFKFGDTFYAEKFATELFNGYLAENREWLLSNNEIVVLPSPYLSIPTASNYLCHFFNKALNNFLFKNEKKSCIESKIYRRQTYIEDYGSMSYEQRIGLISNDTYYIDRNFINGKTCIFMDDIKITGSHEFIINKILKDYNLNGDFHFVYFAELCNTNINPNIENKFNHSFVKNYKDIIKISQRSTFKFNTRVIKFVLNLPQHEFEIVFENLSIKQKHDFFDYAISNNYHQISAYNNNIKILNI